MTFHQQGTKRNCGQIAVAAIVNRSVAHIERLIGHNHGTQTKELARVLRMYSYSCDDHCTSHLRYIGTPNLCLAQVHQPFRSGWHWIAISKGMVYDGHNDAPMLLADYLHKMHTLYLARITSYLELRRV